MVNKNNQELAKITQEVQDLSAKLIKQVDENKLLQLQLQTKDMETSDLNSKIKQYQDHIAALSG
jgi:chromosome segregation ATPase